MTLFAIRNYDWPMCSKIYVIPFVRLSFPYWRWGRAIPYIQFRLKAHGGCTRSAEDAHSSMAPDSTSVITRSHCKFNFLVQNGPLLHWSWNTNFDCVLFRSPDLAILNVDLDNSSLPYMEIWLTAVCDQSTEDAYSSYRYLGFCRGVRVALHSTCIFHFELWFRLTYCWLCYLIYKFILTWFFTLDRLVPSITIQNLVSERCDMISVSAQNGEPIRDQLLWVNENL
jgi:hypothetical protein